MLYRDYRHQPPHVKELFKLRMRSDMTLTQHIARIVFLAIPSIIALAVLVLLTFALVQEIT